MRGSASIALAVIALALATSAARAQSESESERESESESESIRAELAPAVADGHLASIDDGIDEQFSAWVSERMYAGSLGSSGGAGLPVVSTPSVGSTLGSASTVMLLTELGARFGLTPDTRVRADWGFAYESAHVVGTYMDTTTSVMHYDASQERVAARNPVLSFEWAPLIGTARFSFGLGVAIPSAAGAPIPNSVAQAASHDASYLAYALMIASAGGLAPWRYRAERMGIFLPIALSFPVGRMTLTIEGAAALAAPVTGAGRVPTTGDLQADVQLSGDITPEVRLGARAGLAVLDIGSNQASGTWAQPSLSGYVRVRLDPVFLTASLLVDVGGNYGLGSGGGVWSATIGGGAAVP